jgi:hypothetical protein
MFDVLGDHRRGIECLPARRFPVLVNAKQGKQSIAEVLVHLAPRSYHRLRDSSKEAIDNEHGIERELIGRHLRRAAHIDEHTHDITLFAGVNAIFAVHE